ncbi:4Fe-4S dicluster domain-containing protein [Actinotalea sp. M2MS4P-6]|uniref:4Fe-4S dicluster domain-containing protein n=1 Tax=Actinotalea sp. M2MS4P-6 TaxID=2983762 RepID=UPI0021E36AB8|nr:4Fe-4S dicluster domain-containing protein [Actinotalea sp. M2MS4P-6]MCV2394222.1 4Fe-4S dicluster domain-containing protein [Actinotalea sp. M2MS4P-6]
MATVVNIDLMGDLQKFGAADVNACFSCGNCTAICPLSDNDATFPRRVIRYAQVGLTDELLGSKELWTCYHCGLCSDSCPTQADPGEFMAAARRYAIASYEPTGLARVLYTKPVIGTVIAVLVAAFFATFMLTQADLGGIDAPELALFDFVPNDVVHWLGIVVMAAMFLAGAWGVVRMVRAIGKRDGVTLKDTVGSGAAWKRTLGAVWDSLGIESLGQKRFRDDCHDDQEVEPLWRRRWLVHALTIWGFLGLFGATLIDYGLELLGIKETGTPIPLWYPSRALGTVAGLSLMYGVTVFMIGRWKKWSTAQADSKGSDWLFLSLLWITGFTGFVIEVALYMSAPPAWGYWVFLVHVAVAMELMLMLPFTKFAHAMYRPVALFFYALARERSTAGA